MVASTDAMAGKCGGVAVKCEAAWWSAWMADKCDIGFKIPSMALAYGACVSVSLLPVYILLLQKRMNI